MKGYIEVADVPALHGRVLKHYLPSNIDCDDYGLRAADFGSTRPGVERHTFWSHFANPTD